MRRATMCMKCTASDHGCVLFSCKSVMSVVIKRHIYTYSLGHSTQRMIDEQYL